MSDPSCRTTPPDAPGGAPAAPEAGDEAGRAEAARLYGFAGTVTLFTLLSRVLGLVRDLVIAHRYGAGGATDAWVQAFRIPNALRRLTAEGSMNFAFVPTYVKVRTERGEAEARLFAQRVLGLVLAVTLGLTAVGVGAAHWLTLAFSPGFANDPAKFDLTVLLLRWCFPYLVLVSSVAWAMGVLNAEGRFAAPAAAPALLNVGIIAAVLLLDWAFAQPIMAVAAGVLAGGLAQVVLQLPSLRATGHAPQPRLGWSDPDLRRLFALLLPSLFGVAVYQLNIIVLGILASFLPTGQIFHYNNATRLTEVVMGLFTFAFTTAGLPTLSEHQARRDWVALSRTLRLTFAATLYTIVPAMVGLMFGSDAIVAMLYLHGAFHLPDVVSTARTLQMMAWGMPAVALVRVMVPVFYAFDDARSPVLAAGAGLCATAALGWWLSQRYEVAGLAAGLSAGTWFQAALLAALLRPKTRPLPPWFPWRSVGLQALAAAAMGAGVLAVQRLGTWSLGPFSGWNWLVFASFVLGGALVYLGGTLALGEGEARNWLHLINRLLRRLRGSP